MFKNSTIWEEISGDIIWGEFMFNPQESGYSGYETSGNHQRSSEPVRLKEQAKIVRSLEEFSTAVKGLAGRDNLHPSELKDELITLIQQLTKDELETLIQFNPARPGACRELVECGEDIVSTVIKAAEDRYERDFPIDVRSRRQSESKSQRQPTFERYLQRYQGKTLKLSRFEKALESLNRHLAENEERFEGIVEKLMQLLKTADIEKVTHSSIIDDLNLDPKLKYVVNQVGNKLLSIVYAENGLRSRALSYDDATQETQPGRRKWAKSPESVAGVRKRWELGKPVVLAVHEEHQVEVGAEEVTIKADISKRGQNNSSPDSAIGESNPTSREVSPSTEGERDIFNGGRTYRVPESESFLAREASQENYTLADVIQDEYRAVMREIEGSSDEEDIEQASSALPPSGRYIRTSETRPVDPVLQAGKTPVQTMMNLIRLLGTGYTFKEGVDDPEFDRQPRGSTTIAQLSPEQLEQVAKSIVSKRRLGATAIGGGFYSEAPVRSKTPELRFKYPSGHIFHAGFQRLNHGVSFNKDNPDSFKIMQRFVKDHIKQMKARGKLPRA